MLVKLKDIGIIITGTTPKTSITDYYANDDYMFIGPSDLQIGKFIRKTEKHIQEEIFQIDEKEQTKNKRVINKMEKI